MSKIALITGITGQDGSYLAELLLQKKYVVQERKKRLPSYLKHMSWGLIGLKNQLQFNLVKIH